jgi:pimeloyl-ACP methyl ester carboxylesterase
MKCNIYIFLYFFALLFSCSSSDEAVDTIPQEINAGYQKLLIAHPDGGQLWAGVWYPTTEAETAYVYNSAVTNLDITGFIAENSPTAAGNWPLVVFSHGFSGGGIGSVEICEALARAGYVVAAVDHSDAVLAVRVEGQATGTIGEALQYLNDNPFDDGTDYEYRIGETEAVVSAIQAKTEFNLSSELVLGGHSMGGWTVMKTMELGIDADAIFVFSMGELNWLFTGNRYFEAPFFQNLEIPTAYYYGGVEYQQALDAGRGNIYAAFCYEHSPSPSYGLLVAEGNHFTYNSSALAPGSGGTTTQFNSINGRLINFLDKHIKNMDVLVSEDLDDVSK